jgi:hypothetical protein
MTLRINAAPLVCLFMMGFRAFPPRLATESNYHLFFKDVNLFENLQKRLTGFLGMWYERQNLQNHGDQ